MKIYSWFKKASDWFNDWVENVSKEYQLDKYNLPELEQIKQAHELLLREYVRVLSAITRLSLFVGSHEVRFSRSSPSRGVFFLLLSKFLPFRLFVMRPLVNLFAEMHIQAKLKELNLIYAQTSYLIPLNYHQRNEYLTWINQARAECDGLAATLSSWKIFFDTAKYLVLFVGAIFSAIAGINSIPELIKLTLSNSLTVQNPRFIGVTVVTALTFAPYIFVMYEATFDIKRSIFLNTKPIGTSIPNIYVLENSVFDLLGRGKPKEVPIDYWIDFLFHLVLIALFWGIHLSINSLPKAAHVVVCDWTWCITVPLIIKLVVDVFMPWYRRSLERNM